MKCEISKGIINGYKMSLCEGMSWKEPFELRLRVAMRVNVFGRLSAS